MNDYNTRVLYEKIRNLEKKLNLLYERVDTWHAETESLKKNREDVYAKSYEKVMKDYEDFQKYLFEKSLNQMFRDGYSNLILDENDKDSSNCTNFVYPDRFRCEEDQSNRDSFSSSHLYAPYIAQSA